MIKKNSSEGLVTNEVLLAKFEELEQNGTDSAFDEIMAFEPVLAKFIEEKCAAVSGRLALCGVPSELVKHVHNDLVTVVLGSVISVRQGHFDLWNDQMTVQSSKTTTTSNGVDQDE